MVLSPKSALSRLEVVVAIITNSQDEVLVARRAAHKHQGGLWEFPGGKVEAGERLEAALSREIYEELGISVQKAQPFMQLTHDYPDKTIILHVWQVTQFQGEAYGKEQQPIAWVPKAELLNLSFPEANQVILQRFLAN